MNASYLTALNYLLELGVAAASAYAIFVLVKFQVNDPSYCTWRVWLSVVVCMSIFPLALLFVHEPMIRMWLLSIRNLVGIILLSAVLPTLFAEGVNKECPVVKKYKDIFIVFLSLFILEMMLMIALFTQPQAQQ